MLSLPLLALLQVVPPQPRDLAGLLAPIVAEARMPAMGAAIITSTGLEALGVAGVRSWGAAAAVTDQDRWHIGSCTKAITATLTARLVDRGVLSWETTIGDVFGAGTPAIDPTWRSVTLLWLLSHRSGAALNFDDEPWERIVRAGGPPAGQRRALVADALSRPPPSPPNTVTRYSNAGVIIAGAMLETLTGTSWEDLVRREVFEPLGMKATAFGAPGTAGLLDQPLGHTRAAGGWTPVPVGPGADNPPATGPTGTVHTSLGDWARFVGAHLRGRRGDRSFLSAQSWRRLHEPGGAGWEYAPGWVATQVPWAAGAVLHHIGSNQFWIAEATVALDDDVAILIVANGADDSIEAPFRAALAALVRDHSARRVTK